MAAACSLGRLNCALLRPLCSTLAHQHQSQAADVDSVLHMLKNVPLKKTEFEQGTTTRLYTRKLAWARRWHATKNASTHSSGGATPLATPLANPPLPLLTGQPLFNCQPNLVDLSRISSSDHTNKINEHLAHADNLRMAPAFGPEGKCASVDISTIQSAVQTALDLARTALHYCRSRGCISACFVVSMQHPAHPLTPTAATTPPPTHTDIR